MEQLLIVQYFGAIHPAIMILILVQDIVASTFMME